MTKELHEANTTAVTHFLLYICMMLIYVDVYWSKWLNQSLQLHNRIYGTEVAANIIIGRAVLNVTAPLNSVLSDGSNMNSGQLVQNTLDSIMQIIGPHKPSIKKEHILAIKYSSIVQGHQYFINAIVFSEIKLYSITRRGLENVRNIILFKAISYLN
jgi:hypothetical protein